MVITDNVIMMADEKSGNTIVEQMLVESFPMDLAYF